MTTLTAAVAFLTNDAGVVAAATLMLYPTALLLQLALAETSSRSTSSTRR